MGPTHPDLAAAQHPWLALSLWLAAGAYAAAFAVTAVRPGRARPLLLAGVVVHLAGTVGRGLGIGFFPLTNKMESFNAAALSLALVAVIAYRPSRAYLLPLLTVLGAAMAGALSLPGDLRWPPPLMRTLWYPLHIPLSFLAYAAWTASAAAAVAWWTDRREEWLAHLDRLALWGLALWSFSMITGGVWGVVAWGAYFLWDPKVIWSVILWFHYAAFVHVKLTPSLLDRDGLRPALAVAGFLFVLVAYVGTSFFFGRSSHAFG